MTNRFLLYFLLLLTSTILAQTNKGIHTFESYYHPNGVYLYNNLKEFKNVIATKGKIYSLARFPQTNALRTQQSSRGLKLITTNYKKGTIKPFYKKDYGNLPVKKIYQNNNKIADIDKIFMLYDDKYGGKTYRRISFDLNDNSNPYIKDFTVTNPIELNESGNINTYNLGEMVVGNGVGAFMGFDALDNKRYLFLHNFSDNNALTKIDITGFSKNIKQQQNIVLFTGVLKTKYGDERFKNVPIWLDKVINNYAYTYVFFKTNASEALLPIRISKDGSFKVITEHLLNSNRFVDTEYSTKKIRRSGVHYLPHSQGFINHYYSNNVKQEQATIEVYDKEFGKLWKMTVDDIKIQHIYESGDYIILGGYTETKGFRGFPNPRIIVINKTTRSISYDKVISKKNYQVDFITSTNEGNILFSLGTPCCKTNYDTDKNLKPQIIIDKLQPFGVFENDLFTSSN